MTIEQLTSGALAAGFSQAGALNPSSINCNPLVRDMCAACAAYGKTWVCPPACGTIEECQERIGRFSTGLIVQTTGQLEDEFDGETTMETMAKHADNVSRYYKELRGNYPGDSMMCLGAGGCNRCNPCTYPGEPCRFPDEQNSSMEAYGMVVAETCKANGIDYYYGKCTITFVSCYLFQ
ncbi:MAG: DUF2284 domain-containing protein [Oscillospiraceae bacterium]|jgi:predicted metal-binding protein|nr:DUF2284 domain-containing protein [Oscillospiraceae bacterium]